MIILFGQVNPQQTYHCRPGCCPSSLGSSKFTHALTKIESSSQIVQQARSAIYLGFTSINWFASMELFHHTYPHTERVITYCVEFLKAAELTLAVFMGMLVK